MAHFVRSEQQSQGARVLSHVLDVTGMPKALLITGQNPCCYYVYDP